MKKLTSFLAAAALAAMTAACGQTDTGITTKIKTKMAQDDLVKAHEINVTTQERVVTLTGDVENVAVKQQAVRLARETDGVVDVIDQLHVEVAGTSGELDNDLDVDADGDLKRGLNKVGSTLRKGVDKTVEGTREAGEAVRDSVTDKDRDTDKDGK
jgi:hypothetical protein